MDDHLEKLVKPAKRSLKTNLTGAKEDENQRRDARCFRRIMILMLNSNIGCYSIISKEQSGINSPKRREWSICKEQHIPLGYTPLFKSFEFGKGSRISDKKLVVLEF